MEECDPQYRPDSIVGYIARTRDYIVAVDIKSKCLIIIEFLEVVSIRIDLLQNLKYKKTIPEGDNSSVWANECRKYLCVGRNAIAVIAGTLLAYILSVNGLHPFALTGKLSHWHRRFSRSQYLRYFHR